MKRKTPLSACDTCPSQPKLKSIEAKVEEAERLITELSRLVAELKQSLEKK